MKVHHMDLIVQVVDLPYTFESIDKQSGNARHAN